MRSHSRFSPLAIIVIAVIWPTTVHAAAAGHSSGWLVGPALRQRLREPIGPAGASWSGTPLRQAIRELSAAKQVAILLDRRVDPDQKLDLSIGNRPLEEALVELAIHRGMGVCFFGPVVYFAPATVTSRLRTLVELRREEITKLAPAARSRFTARRPLEWDDFATPRELLKEAARSSRVEIDGLDRAPHDLWTAADLPPLDLVERLTLIAGQFDLTFQVASDGGTVTLVPVPREVALVRSYPGGAQPDVLAAKWAELVPDCQIKVVGQQIYVKGLLEDHERLISPRQPTGSEPAQPTPVDKIRIDSLSVKNQPLRLILKHLREKMALDVQVDEAAIRGAGISLDQIVSFEVKDANVDELFTKILEPAGLRFERRGRVVRIAPASR